MSTDQEPFYRCGGCPPGLTGTGSDCRDIDEVRIDSFYSQFVNLTIPKNKYRKKKFFSKLEKENFEIFGNLTQNFEIWENLPKKKMMLLKIHPKTTSF